MATVGTTVVANISHTNTSGGPPASFEQQVVISVVIAVLGVWTTIGNTVTILTITTRRYMRTKTNVFILSLATSDLLSGVVASPLWLYRRTWGFSEWEWGEFPCQLYWIADESTSYCTSWHIASFAIWRYILIKWPLRVRSLQMRKITIWTTVVWTISLCGGIATSSFAAVIKKSDDTGALSTVPMCSLDPGQIRIFLPYYVTSSTIFIIFPMSVMLTTSALIAKELLFGKKFKGRDWKDKEKKAVLQLALVATSFIIGYVPVTTYQLWTPRVKTDITMDYWLGVGVYFSLRLSESMNPVLYNIASSKMWCASKEVLSKICASSSNTTRSYSTTV